MMTADRQTTLANDDRPVALPVSGFFRRNRPYIGSVAVLDYVVLVVAAGISHTWDLERQSIWDPGPAWVAVFTGPLLVVLVAEALSVYRHRITLSALDTIPELIA